MQTAIALAALDAIVRVSGQNGDRTIPFEQFHRLTTNYIGKPTNRVDGRAKVTGEAKYAAEFKF